MHGKSSRYHFCRMLVVFSFFAATTDVKVLKLSDLLPTFYKNIIAYWQELNTHVPNNKEEVLNQTIWNNRFIKINQASVFYQNWNRNGVQNLSCLMNVSENSFLSFDSFQRKFNLKCTFLQYFGLLAAIPRQWKDLLNVQGSQETPTSQLTIDKLNCKDLYNLIINCKNLPPPMAEKRLIECGYDASKRRIIYSLPFRVTKEITPAVFQYKIIRNELYSNSLLHKMKKVNSPDCPFCANTEQTTLHLFVSCPVAISFWSDFIPWYHQICNKNPFP